MYIDWSYLYKIYFYQIRVEIFLHKLQKFMQIKLEKYFMIIRSAQAHQWEREREHLDHIKIRTGMQARQNPPFVSERVWTFCIIVSAHHVAHRFLAAYPPSCLSCLTNFAHISRILPPQWRAHTRACYNFREPPVSLNHAEAVEQDGGATIGKWEGENFAIHWDRAFKPGRRICPNISSENLLLKAFLLFSSVLRLCCL